MVAVRRKIAQVMLVLIMLFGLTAWTIGGRAPVRPAPEQAAETQDGIKRGGEMPDPRPAIDFPYPISTEVAYP